MVTRLFQPIRGYVKKETNSMSIAALIAEYDPFHAGHAWQLAELRRLLERDEL